MARKKSSFEVIIYDGNCRFCHLQIQKIKKLDNSSQFTYISSNSSSLSRYGISKEKAMRGIIFIDSKCIIYHKARAIQEIYKRLNPYHFLSWGKNVPLLSLLIDLGYYFIAKYRYKIYGSCDDACKV
jgi:predicted DCC family thiol-disulfide oxidoreductase YuxK